MTIILNSHSKTHLRTNFSSEHLSEFLKQYIGEKYRTQFTLVSKMDLGFHINYIPLVKELLEGEKNIGKLHCYVEEKLVKVKTSLLKPTIIEAIP